jgi:hypothetical protein
MIDNTLSTGTKTVSLGAISASYWTWIARQPMVGHTLSIRTKTVSSGAISVSYWTWIARQTGEPELASLQCTKPTNFQAKIKKNGYKGSPVNCLICVADCSIRPDLLHDSAWTSPSERDLSGHWSVGATLPPLLFCKQLRSTCKCRAVHRRSWASSLRGIFHGLVRSHRTEEETRAPWSRRLPRTSFARWGIACPWTTGGDFCEQGSVRGGQDMTWHRRKTSREKKSTPDLHRQASGFRQIMDMKKHRLWADQ